MRIADSDLGQICALVKQSRHEITDAVIRNWTGIQQKEPWLELPADLSRDHIPELIAALADASLCTLFGDEERRRLVWTAVEHGQQRRQHGYEENLVYREYTLLRRALWHDIRERFAATGLASAAVVRLDAAVSLAIGASLRGYYRATLEGSGDWPSAIERLIDEFSFPGTD